MEYETGKKYPKEELGKINAWWEKHRRYDVNEYRDYVVIVERSSDKVKESLRARRETECFPVINRGQPWYEGLTEERKEELKEWYKAWLNVTQTLEAPDRPQWLK